MKARRIDGLDPDGPLADNAQRIVEVRLAELCGFWPRAADAEEVTALHDMRIAAKRLRYVLEVTHPCFGASARAAIKVLKDLQDLLGEVHDCDVQAGQVSDLLERRMAADADALAAGREPPHRGEYAGLVALVVGLRGRRARLFDTFVARWRETEGDGFRARLEQAVSQRP